MRKATKMTIRKEFLVERQGKTFCLYAGVLALAHEQGLKSITTSLVQVPSEANNRVAICTATVVLEKDGVERVFTGIGDAAPNNVAPAMQTCLIRMSETRSKARALRDAVNVGMAAFEELGEELPAAASTSAVPEYREPKATRPPVGTQRVRQPSAADGKCRECGTTGKYHRADCSFAPVAV